MRSIELCFPGIRNADHEKIGAVYQFAVLVNQFILDHFRE
jgi:hypothetical protein